MHPRLVHVRERDATDFVAANRSLQTPLPEHFRLRQKMIFTDREYIYPDRTRDGKRSALKRRGAGRQFGIKKFAILTESFSSPPLECDKCRLDSTSQ